MVTALSQEQKGKTAPRQARAGSGLSVQWPVPGAQWGALEGRELRATWAGTPSIPQGLRWSGPGVSPVRSSWDLASSAARAPWPTTAVLTGILSEAAQPQQHRPWGRGGWWPG